MQQYGRLVIKNSVLDSLVCSGDSLILETASPRTHKPKIVNESLNMAIIFFLSKHWRPAKVAAGVQLNMPKPLLFPHLSIELNDGQTKHCVL